MSDIFKHSKTVFNGLKYLQEPKKMRLDVTGIVADPEMIGIDVNDYHEKYVWRDFNMRHKTLAEQTVEWRKLAKDYYRAKLANGDLIFFEVSESGYRPVPEKNTDYGNDDLWLKEFASRLRYLMRSCGITQQDLSEATGFSQPTISSWINHRVFPSSSAVARLIDLFGCDPSFLTTFW